MVRECRRFVANTLDEWGCLDDGSVVLLTDELFVNSEQAGSSFLDVKVIVDHDTVRVEVRDDAPGVPTLLDVGPSATSGRGLRVVDRLSDSWGFEPTGTGKVTWFEKESTSAFPRANA
jgi:hypothetical protein